MDEHRAALERLAAKVTHVGHSASFVQAWVESECEAAPRWVPTDGIATHRFRIPSSGSLERLARRFDAPARAVEQAEMALKAMTPPPRKAWPRGFPDAILLADETTTKRHALYAAAKTGDDLAAANLVDSLVDEAGVRAVQALVAEASKSDAPLLVSAHAFEREGINAIPAALAQLLAQRLGLEFSTDVAQLNVVSHTGADGYGRLARQARFEGDVHGAREYVMVDDFIGQGGTLANLRGWIEKQGGKVVGAVGLTGKPYSAKLSPSKEQLHELRQKHGADLEKWWRKHFGHAYGCLTQSEARYLARSPDVDTIRVRLAAAEGEGNRPDHPRSARPKKREHIRKLRLQPPLRPVPGRWQGYDRPQAQPSSEAPPHSVFDPRFVVLTIAGRRPSLPATLRLSAALRGLLMRECPQQPPPEWLSGHRASGQPSALPHMALVPLAFTGSQYADGRIMGLAVVLPRALAPQEASRCFESILRDPGTGLPRESRLFDGRIECTVALETREHPPTNLAPRTWTKASRTWASVTPVALNRHFDGDDQWSRSAESVKDMCEHIGLPRPREVLLHPVSLVEGVPHARQFPQLVRKADGGRRKHHHAVAIFDEPVCGPVLLGAGRFRGYGLLRPIDEGHGAVGHSFK